MIASQMGIQYEVAPKMGISDGINALRMRFSSFMVWW